MATVAEIAQTLRSGLGTLTERDRDFAVSLLAGVDKYGAPTERQLPHLVRLARIARDGYSPKQVAEVGSLEGLKALFDRAGRNLKKPAIVVTAPGVGELRISVAGSNARVPGSVNVATNDGFGNSTWFGRIVGEGRFEASDRVEQPEALVPFLRRFAASPAEVAAEHGHLTGKCCFCNQKLTDERSTAVGYGKTCAGNYGLPWGAK